MFWASWLPYWGWWVTTLTSVFASGVIIFTDPHMLVWLGFKKDKPKPGQHRKH